MHSKSITKSGAKSGAKPRRMQKIHNTKNLTHEINILHKYKFKADCLATISMNQLHKNIFILNGILGQILFCNHDDLKKNN